MGFVIKPFMKLEYRASNRMRDQMFLSMSQFQQSLSPGDRIDEASPEDMPFK
jgi:hypothetical protein